MDLLRKSSLPSTLSFLTILQFYGTQLEVFNLLVKLKRDGFTFYLKHMENKWFTDDCQFQFPTECKKW